MKEDELDRYMRHIGASKPKQKFQQEEDELDEYMKSVGARRPLTNTALEKRLLPPQMPGSPTALIPPGEEIIRPTELRPPMERTALEKELVPEERMKARPPTKPGFYALKGKERERWAEALLKEELEKQAKPLEERKPYKEMERIARVGVPRLYGKEREVIDVPGQFLTHAANMYLWGIPGKVNEMVTGETLPQPRTELAEIAGGTGALAGMIGGKGTLAPFKVTAKLVNSLLKKAPRTAVGKVLQSTVRGSLALSLASGAVEWEGENIKEIATSKIRAAVSAAPTGAVFGIAPYLKLASQYPILSKALRIGAGSAAIDLIHGQHPFDERSLFRKSYDYGLNVFFLRHEAPSSMIERLAKEGKRFNKQAKSEGYKTDFPETVEGVYSRTFDFIKPAQEMTPKEVLEYRTVKIEPAKETEYTKSLVAFAHPSSKQRGKVQVSLFEKRKGKWMPTTDVQHDSWESASKQLLSLHKSIKPTAKTKKEEPDIHLNEKLDPKIDLPYEEWVKSDIGGFINLEIKDTFGASKKSRIYQDLFDRFHPIKKLTDIVKKEGIELPFAKDPYTNIRNYLGVQGKSETKLMYKRFEVDAEANIRYKGKSLKDIVKPIKKNIDAFDRYLIYRRVPELEGRGIKTGIDIKKAKEFNSKHKSFEPMAKEVTEYANSLLNELVDSGLLSKSKAETIKRNNQMYVPFKRVMEDLKTYKYIPSSKKLLSKVTAPLKRIKGSERPIKSPLESIVEATYTITEAVERNRIANQIIALRGLSPEIARIIKPVKPNMAVVAVLKDGTKVFRPSVFQKEGIIELMKDGKRHFFKVPKELYDSMAQLEKTGQNWLIKMLALPARWLRTGATTAPEFAFRNPVRDQWFAFVNSKYGFIPGWDFAKGLFDLVKKPEMYWRWKAAGGEWSMLVTLDKATNQANLKKVLGKKDAKRYLRNPLSFLEDVSMYTEIPTRLGVFKRAAKKTGVSDIEAAFQSREGSIDFARRGAKMKTISALYTFLNARLQGIDKLMRTFKERPMTTTAKIMAVSVIPSIGNYLLNRDDPTYWEIPQWQRDLFWIIPVKRTKVDEEGKITQKGIYLRIPKGDVGVIFGTTTERILEHIDRDEKGKMELDKLAISMIKEASPISDVGGFLPTAFRAPFEAMANKNFFLNRPIVSQGRERLEKKYQYSPWTSETTKAIGSVFNVSPSRIEHVVTGYGGGLARHALKLNDIIMGEMGILPTKAKRPTELADIPLIKAFSVRDPRGFGSESVQKFYDTLEKMERFSTTYKRLRETGMTAEVQKYLRKNKVQSAAKYYKLDTTFRRARNDLAALRKMRDVILQSKKISVEEKRKAIDGINSIVMAIVIPNLNRYKAVEQKTERR